jgi:hypothetical protein
VVSMEKLPYWMLSFVYHGISATPILSLDLSGPNHPSSSDEPSAKRFTRRKEQRGGER